MLRSILFDLDGTLLMHDIEQFLPKYLGLITRQLGGRFPDCDLVSLIMKSTMFMMQNNGTRTNEEAFWADFLPRIDRPREELEPLFIEFYERDFPSLGAGIEREPEAAALIAACRSRGLRVALATNPIFPRMAIDERLRWAGIDPGHFDLVTSYEWMRFSKPHPGYYRQVADELAIAPAECLMVGNDIGQDLVPAAAAGMRTCLLDNAFQVAANGPKEFTPDYTCKLSEVADLAEGL